MGSSRTPVHWEKEDDFRGGGRLLLVILRNYNMFTQIENEDKMTKNKQVRLEKLKSTFTMCSNFVSIVCIVLIG